MSLTQFQRDLQVCENNIHQVLKNDKEASEFSYLRKNPNLFMPVAALIKKYPQEFAEWIHELGADDVISSIDAKNVLKMSEERFVLNADFNTGEMHMRRGVLTLSSQPMKDILVLMRAFAPRVDVTSNGFYVFMVSVMLNENSLRILNTAEVLKRYY